MKSKMSFQERAKLGMENLSKQKPVTLEEARAQVLRLKTQSNIKNRKQRIPECVTMYHGKPYKLYLDDWRNPKSEGWIIVRSYDEFVNTIKELGVPVEISFDHDIGWDEINNCERKSGYDCAKWLVENDMLVENFNVHSANPAGKKNIEMLLNNYKKFRSENGLEYSSQKK